MNNTFESIFPTFLTKCGELHTLLLSVAFAFFVTGIIVTVHNHFSDRQALHLVARLLMLTSLLVYLPAWGNVIQNLLQTTILSGLGVDPANVHQQFLHLLVIKRDDTQTSWWDVIAQLHNITTDLIVTVLLWFIGLVASLLMYWAYIFQTVILNMGYALSPLLIGFMAIPHLRSAGTRYLTNLAGVLLWPLGWGIAALVTQGFLDFMSDPSFEFIDPSSNLPDLQKTIGVAAVGFWIIFSTIAAPVIIQHVISTGMLATTGLFSGGAQVAMQTANSAISGASAGVAGGPLAAIGMAGAAGTAALLSTSANVGNAGSLVTGLAKFTTPKDDQSGDKTVREMLRQLAERSNFMAPPSPKKR
jgi:hypothetical protein